MNHPSTSDSPPGSRPPVVPWGSVLTGVVVIAIGIVHQIRLGEEFPAYYAWPRSQVEEATPTVAPADDRLDHAIVSPPRPPAVPRPAASPPADVGRPMSPPAAGRRPSMLTTFEEEHGPSFADPSKSPGEVVAVSSLENGLCEVEFGGRIASRAGETLRVYRGNAYLGTLRVLRWRDNRLVGLGMEEVPRVGDKVETPDGSDE